MQCCAHLRPTTSGRRTHRSAVCSRSARAGQLRKLRRTQALLRTHTHPGPGSVYRRGSSPAASRFPPATGVEMFFFMENFPTVPTDRVRPLAKNLGTRSSWGGLWGVHEQYLSNLWATGHAVLCMWKPERRSFTHSKSHDWLPSVRFFPEPFRELKTTQCGG